MSYVLYRLVYQGLRGILLTKNAHGLYKKFGFELNTETRIFDEYADYYTVRMLKDSLIEMFDMEEDYVQIPSTLEPPQENADHFLPWFLDDQQYIDRNYLAYFVTKAYWPEIVSDWSY